MKHGLVLGLDGVGKTLLLRQLACHLRKSHKGVLEKLAAIASSVSTVAGFSAASHFGSAATDGSGSGLEGPIESADSDRHHHHSNSQHHQKQRHHQVHHRHHQHHHPHDHQHQHHYSRHAATAATTTSTTTTGISLETQPTVGVEHTSLPLEARGGAVVMCEVGAQLLPMWKAYFANCDFWVFVLDVSNAAQIAGSAIEFFNVLSHDAMRRKPKLLLLNKVDASFALDDALLLSYLQLDRLLASADGYLLHVVKVSAATGENLDAVVKWLGQRCSSSNNNNTSSSSGGVGGAGISSRSRHRSISRASSNTVGTTRDNINNSSSSPSRHRQEAPTAANVHNASAPRGGTCVHPVTAAAATAK